MALNLCSWKIGRVVYTLVVFIYLCDFCHCAGEGRVNIGIPGIVSPNLFSFSNNSNNNQIPIYLTTTVSIAAVDTVTVVCEVLPTEPTAVPFTSVQFSNATLTTTAVNGSVPVTIARTGRPVKFRCYGLSHGSSAVFNAISSRSQTKSVQGKLPPTVSICEPTVIIPNVKATLTNLVFTVKFSEPVVDHNVTLECGAIGSPNSSLLNISISTPIIPVGSSIYVIAFELLSSGLPLTYGCRGISNSPGTQYLASNSLGSTAIFSIPDAVVNFVPNRAQISATSFALSLVLDRPISTFSQDVTFVCTVALVTSDLEEQSAIANAKCDTSAANTTNSTSADSIEGWSVNNNGRVNFQKNQMAQNVTIRRSTTPTAAITERLVAVCCAPSTNEEPKYRNVSASASITVSFPKLAPVNASASNTDTETVLQNTAYINPAPCPCDLLPSQCDPGCCCDSRCTTQDKQLFNCMSGYFGGNTSSIPPAASSCLATNQYGQEDYNQFMCVMFENNAIIGRFYQPTAVGLKTIQAVTQRETTTNVAYKLNSDPKRIPTEASTSTTGYNKGNAILFSTGTTAYTAGLTLPGSVSSGICSSDTMVRYLEDRTSACPITVPTDCNNPILSARHYALSSNLRQPACPEYPQIRAAGQLGGNLKTSVDYFCVENATQLRGIYLEQLTTTTPDPTNAGFPTISCTTFDNQTFLCNATSFGSGPSGGSVLAKRCTFDNGESLPDAPTLNTATNVCQNTVINVSYSFSWNGSVLTELRAFVLLADVPVSQVLTQRFKVNFTHGILSSINASAINRKRSGVFGYDDNRPIIGGTVNVTSNQIVDSSSAYQPFMIKPGTDGLCSNAGKEPILFPYGTSSSCSIYLKLDDFKNCNKLRQQLMAYVDLMIPFNVLGVYGDPTDSDRNDWATMYTLNSVLTNDTMNATTANVTQQTSSAFDSTSNTTYNVTGTSIADQMLNTCYDIPVGVHINVIYARQGEARDVPIYQIIGVAKGYDIQNITLQCDSSPNSPCVDTTRGAKFFIGLSYRFVEGPRTWKTNIWAGTTTPTKICWWDVCMEDLLSIWTSAVYAEIHMQSVGYSLLSAFVLLPTLYFAWPW